MSPEQVQWMPALIALGAGAAVGIFFLFRSRGARPAQPADVEAVVALRDLEEERESILAQLRELDDLALSRDARQLIAERRELEIQGARVLRELDLLEAPRRKAAPPPASSSEPSSPWVSFAWGVGAVIAIALIGLFVSRSTTQKEGSAMAPAAMAEPSAAPSPELAQLEAAVKANPDDLETRLALTRQYLMTDRLMEVYANTEYILQRDPGHPAALTYQSIVRAAMGETDNAIAMIQRALERDPDFIDAYVQLAVIHSSAGRRGEAENAMREAIRRHPEEKQALETLLAQIAGPAGGVKGAYFVPRSARTAGGTPTG